MEDAGLEPLTAILSAAQAMSLVPRSGRARAFAATLGTSVRGLVVLAVGGQKPAGSSLPSSPRAAREAALASALRGLDPGPLALLAWEPDETPASRLGRPPCGWCSASGNGGLRALVATWREPATPLDPRERSILRAGAEFAAARLGELSSPERLAQEEDLRVRALALGLTPCEADVAVLVAQGLGNREVARELGTSAQTVKDHLAASYRKTGLRGRGRLAAALLGPSAGAE